MASLHRAFPTPRSARLLVPGLVVLVTAGVLPVVARIPLADRGPTSHAAAETAAGLISLLVAYLFLGRLRPTPTLDAVCLTCAMIAFGVANLGAAAAAIDSRTRSLAFGMWAPTCGRVIGSVALVAAAFLPSRPVRSDRTPRRLLALTVGALMLVGAYVWRFPQTLPGSVGSSLADSVVAVGERASVLRPTELFLSAAFAAAAVAFARRWVAVHDEFIAWLAAACTLSAMSRFSGFLHPTVYADRLYASDVLRLFASAILLIGAARVVRTTAHAQAETARLEERRRIARDVHDGLAQELLFISKRARRSDPGALTEIASAAERGLLDSRLAIATLSQPRTEPLGRSLARLVEHIAHRTDAAVRVVVDEDADVRPQVRDAVLRIAGEAVTNAALHAHPSVILVELHRDDRVRLRISDDGVGFEASALPQAGCFGLVSMRERAAALGAQLDIVSRQGAGTRVELALR
jgi:signal transduction histidine kinase